MTDEYTTIGGRAAAELRVRGSRFLARAEPVSSRETVLSALDEVRTLHHDASHHCYAYRIGPAGADFRCQDDGEPVGTAGKPILSVLETAHLTDVLVVVTRYFGGTKLGVGGLVRAYGDAARAVLANAVPRICHLLDQYTVSFPHHQTGNVMHVLTREGARIVESVYDEDVHLTVEIRRSKGETMRESVRDATKGNVDIRPRLNSH